MTSGEALILTGCRTPIGKFLGALSGRTAVELGGAAAKAAFVRAGVDPAEVEEAVVGNVLSAGLGQAPARQVALGAGMPSRSSALTVNMVCGSGLRAVMLAELAVKAGAAGLVLAGGMESMSQAPHLLRGGRAGWKYGDGALVDSLIHDGLTCAFEGWPMGMASERTAEVCGLTREELDEAAVQSHRKAAQAREDGAFVEEIVPVEIPGRKGTVVVATDEGPRPDADLASLAKLAPAFRPDGVVTAGNASSLSDGAAMVLVASSDMCRRLHAKPVARVVASAVSGGDPRDLFLAPVDAVRTVLRMAGLTADQVDLYEINEAFASQLLGCVRRLELDPARVNVNGGAIALGHPIGASGARVLVTLLHTLARRGGRYGVATLCLGGGNAVAMVVESFASRSAN